MDTDKTRRVYPDDWDEDPKPKTSFVDSHGGYPGDDDLINAYFSDVDPDEEVAPRTGTARPARSGDTADLPVVAAGGPTVARRAGKAAKNALSATGRGAKTVGGYAMTGAAATGRVIKKGKDWTVDKWREASDEYKTNPTLRKKAKVVGAATLAVMAAGGIFLIAKAVGAGVEGLEGHGALPEDFSGHFDGVGNHGAPGAMQALAEQQHAAYLDHHTVELGHFDGSIDPDTHRYEGTPEEAVANFGLEHGLHLNDHQVAVATHQMMNDNPSVFGGTMEHPASYADQLDAARHLPDSQKLNLDAKIFDGMDGKDAGPVHHYGPDVDKVISQHDGHENVDPYSSSNNYDASNHPGMSFSREHTDPATWDHTNYNAVDASANTDSSRGYEPAGYQTNAALAAAEAAAKANADPANHMATTIATTDPAYWNQMSAEHFTGPDNGGNQAYATAYQAADTHERVTRELLDSQAAKKTV